MCITPFLFTYEDSYIPLQVKKSLRVPKTISHINLRSVAVVANKQSMNLLNKRRETKRVRFRFEMNLCVKQILLHFKLLNFHAAFYYA